MKSFLFLWSIIVILPNLFQILHSKRNIAELLFVGESLKSTSLGKVVASIKPDSMKNLNQILAEKKPDGIIFESLPRSVLRNIVLNNNKPIVHNQKLKRISTRDLFHTYPYTHSFLKYKYHVLDGHINKKNKNMINKSGIKVVGIDKADYVIDLKCILNFEACDIFQNHDKTLSVVESIKMPILIFTPIQPISSHSAIISRAYEALFLKFDTVKIVRIPFLVPTLIPYKAEARYTLWSHLDSILFYISNSVGNHEKIIEFSEGDYILNHEVLAILEKTNNL